MKERWHELYPDISSIWHPSLNKGIDKENVKQKTNVFWLDVCGHSYEKLILNQIRCLPDLRCPFCSGRKLLAGFNDLATTHPELAKQWSDKNELKPTEVLSNSTKKFLWVCEKDHPPCEWSSSVTDKVRNVTKCPFCSGRRVLVGFNDLATTHSDLAKQWSDKNELKPTEVSAGFNKRVLWVCEKDHPSWEWKVSPHNRVAHKTGCGICSGRRVLVGFNDLATTHPDLAKQWSPKNKLKPTEVSAGSGRKVVWICEKGHEFSCAVYAAVNINCPVCSNRTVLVGFNDLATTHPDLAKQWSDKNELKSTEVSAGSTVVGLWDCDKGHEWSTEVRLRVRGSGCLVCSGHAVKAGFNDLATTHPDLVEQWSVKNKLKPTDFSKGSEYSPLWVCDKGHEWSTYIYARSAGAGCPHCTNPVSKGELKLAEFVKSLGIVYEQSNRTVISPQELDIYVPFHNIAIEYNGVFWHSEKYKSRSYHYDKWKACDDKGVQLIQIWEDDWYDKREIVESMLKYRLGVCHELSCVDTTVIKDVSIEDTNAFLDECHIQGSACGSLSLGLFDDGKLMVVMVLDEVSEGLWELVRYATNVSSLVSVGFSMLLKHFECNYGWLEVVSIVDLCVPDGDLFECNGFMLDKIVEPDYMFVGNVTGQKRVNKFLFTLDRFRDDDRLQYEDGLSVGELVELNDLVKVFDAGSQRWIKTNS